MKKLGQNVAPSIWLRHFLLLRLVYFVFQTGQWRVQICIFACDVIKLDINQQKQTRTSDININEKHRTSVINKTKMERLILFNRLSMWQLETQLFVLPCIFNWCTLSRRVKARWSRGCTKNQVSTNQNSGNSWYQIVRGTAC